MANKLMEKLKRLYQLAILRPEEEGDETRINEARTAAFKLFDLARKNGVKIRFEVPREEPTPAPPPPPPQRPAKQSYTSPWYQPTSVSGSRSAEEVSADPNPIELDSNAFWASVSSYFDAQAERMRKAVGIPPEPPRTRRDEYKDSLKDALGDAAARGPRETRTRTGKRKRDDGSILIESKYSGTCIGCGEPYEAGDDIWWRPPFVDEGKNRYVRGKVVHRKCFFPTTDEEEAREEDLDPHAEYWARTKE